jgi:hypothetical protein
MEILVHLGGDRFQRRGPDAGPPEALAERLMSLRDGIGDLLDTWNEGRLYRAEPL